MKLKIISDGTFKGTKLINAITGEIVNQVIEITYEADVKCFPECVATIKLANIEVDITSSSYVELYRVNNGPNYEFVFDSNMTKDTSIIGDYGSDIKIIDTATGKQLGCVQKYTWNVDAITYKCSSMIKQFLLDKSIDKPVVKSRFQIVMEKLFPKKASNGKSKSY